LRMPPLPADFIHARACKLKCEKILTRPKAVIVTRKFQIEDNMPVYGRPSARCRLKIAVWATSPCFYRVV